MAETGTVKWYSSLKGYGFIARPGGKDIFFHESGVEEEGQLQPGEAVTFEAGEGEKGPKARHIRRVS